MGQGLVYLNNAGCIDKTINLGKIEYAVTGGDCRDLYFNPCLCCIVLYCPISWCTKEKKTYRHNRRTFRHPLFDLPDFFFTIPQRKIQKLWGSLWLLYIILGLFIDRAIFLRNPRDTSIPWVFISNYTGNKRWLPFIIFDSYRRNWQCPAFTTLKMEPPSEYW